MRRLVTFVVFVWIVWGLGSLPAGAQEPAAPPGAVAFFNLSSCPTGWTAATLAQGKLILAVKNGADSGLDNGEPPLESKEDRTHAHCYLTWVNLEIKSIAAANGKNDNGAEQGDYLVSGVTDEATTELPFTQLVVCEKE